MVKLPSFILICYLIQKIFLQLKPQIKSLKTRKQGICPTYLRECHIIMMIINMMALLDIQVGIIMKLIYKQTLHFSDVT